MSVLPRDPSDRIEVVTIIVNYKSAPLTAAALASLRCERSCPEIDLRVIVVENDSGEGDVLAANIAADFSDFASLVMSPGNGGFGSGNNFGLRHIQEIGLNPSYVHFLNPDTEVHPGAVRELVRFLE